MRLLACVLLAVAARAADEEAPKVPLLYAGFPYAGFYGGFGYPYAHHALTYAAVPQVGVVPTLGATPVSVGGYKAVAGDNGGLKGAVHEVPGVYGAPALQTQESAGDVSLTTGTGAYAVTGHVLTPHLVGKRSAEPEAEADPEADPWYYYSGLGYGGHYGYAGHYGYGRSLGYARYGYGLGYGYGYPYYGYGARYVANSGGALHVVAKRSADPEPAADPEADPEADPWYYYSGLGYGGYGYGRYGYAGLHGYAGHYGLGYSRYYGYPYSYGRYGHYGYYGK